MFVERMRITELARFVRGKKGTGTICQNGSTNLRSVPGADAQNGACPLFPCARALFARAGVRAWVARRLALAADAETGGEQAARMKWWVDARFGLFLHWGPVSLKGTEIGWSRGRQVPVQVYDNLYRRFNPIKFDAKEYVSLAKQAGMKYLTLVAKHHDGFSMYATRLSDYNIMSTPFHRDVARELARRVPRAGHPLLHLLFDHRLAPSRLSAARGGRQPAGQRRRLRPLFRVHEGAAPRNRRELPPGRDVVRRRMGQRTGRSSEGARSMPCCASWTRRSSSTTG